MRYTTIAVLSLVALWAQSEVWAQEVVPVPPQFDEAKPARAPVLVDPEPALARPAPFVTGSNPALAPAPARPGRVQVPQVVPETTVPPEGSCCGSKSIVSPNFGANYVGIGWGLTPVYLTPAYWGSFTGSYCFPNSGFGHWQNRGCLGVYWGCGVGSLGCGYGGCGWGHWGCRSTCWGGCSTDYWGCSSGCWGGGWGGWHRRWRRCGSGWVCDVVNPSTSVSTSYIAMMPAEIPSFAESISQERASRLIELAASGNGIPDAIGDARLVSVVVTRKPTSAFDPDLAAKYYGAGYSAYWRGDYASALKSLEQALSASDRDARAWYYKGLSEIALKQDDLAVNSLARAVRLQLDNPEQNGQIYGALERIQGKLRIQIQTAIRTAGAATPESGRPAPSKELPGRHVANQ